MFSFIYQLTVCCLYIYITWISYVYKSLSFFVVLNSLLVHISNSVLVTRSVLTNDFSSITVLVTKSNLFANVVKKTLFFLDNGFTGKMSESNRFPQ